MPVIRSEFRPAWWLPGAHLQTLWPAFFRPRMQLQLETERLSLADGDVLDLSWAGPQSGKLVLLLHGLEGSLDSHYLNGVMPVLTAAGYRVLLMHFRGCNGGPNRLARSYHSGDTGDLNQVLDSLAQRKLRPFATIGFSLGGNVLLKWLGEQGDKAGIELAAVVSVPFHLGNAADRLDRGLSRLYQRHLLRSMKRSYREKFTAMRSPLDVDLEQISNIRQFDHQITAPLHGFSSGDDYYQKSSSLQYIAKIRARTLILHARNDPFMTPACIPSESQIPDNTTLELSGSGGHVGFVSGKIPGRAEYWLDRRLLRWLNQGT